ncbi:MAG: 50S ribosomal protein L1 [Candidatus Aenigmarchaeota archaeon]|nr:50S ribosomal protein L1 [Candidatus Aenigmarchaeota archaeon]NIP39941.1 50S ribosomal protein L1 [Candidatus Aenigmarchaeota archaeon]NIQ17660.1 50S ribosomal protein L1 [Candidatus Aenigmarchaeota archaeon]NIS72848.1 50S ribosomal protein L1 [Candidatus Aenigmarchaeota archaeon]
MAEEFLKEIREAKEKAKKRKFIQTWDLIISLKNIDLKKPENKLNLEFPLPEGRGKETKVIFIVDSLLVEAKKTSGLIITKGELEKLGKDKKKLKRYADEYEWWFCEAPLMPLVGKTLGLVLGPRGKMPKPVPPKGSVQPFIEMSKKLVRVMLRDSPVIHVPVGKENMKEEQIMKNVLAVMNFVKEKLPKGKMNMKGACIKLTMGPPVRLKV